jgi:sec-independent protein translocase protein TatC
VGKESNENGKSDEKNEKEVINSATLNEESGKPSEKGPPEDREMELTEHIAELRTHVIRIAVVLIAAISVFFYISPSLIHHVWETMLGSKPIYTFSPIEWFVTRLTFSALLSLIFFYPYIIYELYLFAKPGLYEHERKFLRSLLVPSYVIFLAGVYVSYKFVVPLIYNFAILPSYEPYLSAERTMQNAFRLFIAFGFFFQIPLAMILAEKFRLIDYRTFRNLRIPIYVVVFILITNVSMDFTGLTQITSLLTFIVMYEVGMLLLAIKNKAKSLKAKDL